MKKTIAMVAAIAALSVGSLCATHASTATLPVATVRDGNAGFDFLFGTWHTHYRILRHRLVNSHDWYACDGTSIIRPFWGGGGNLEDAEIHCPNRNIVGMTLRLYNAATQQWSLYWGTTKLGLVLPAQVGRFNAGVGDFFASDTQEGKPVIVRFRLALRSGDHPHFEQAFSTDHGRTWETNWICDFTRS